MNSITPHPGLNVVDESGNIGANFADNILSVPNLKALLAVLLGADANTAISSNASYHAIFSILGTNVMSIAKYGRPLSITDESGNIGVKVDHDGNVFGKSFTAWGTAAKRVFGFLADINLIPSYGQSLSCGWGASGVVTTTQRYNSIMFSGGVSIARQTTYDPTTVLMRLKLY